MTRGHELDLGHLVLASGAAVRFGVMTFGPVGRRGPMATFQRNSGQTTDVTKLKITNEKGHEGSLIKMNFLEWRTEEDSNPRPLDS